MTEDPYLREHLIHLSQRDLLPLDHFNFLKYLRDEKGFTPNVCYDIGACALHWTNKAWCVWPEAEFVLFDAFEPVQFLYPPRKHFIGVLSDEDDKIVKFYQNNYQPGGNSYYKEIGCMDGALFPEECGVEKKTHKLDTVVNRYNFPLPDLIKIDVQGAEIDIIKGATETFKHAKYMIVELQHEEYNRGAWKAHESIPFIESLGWKCIAPLFSKAVSDGDYCFERV
jgi:hypothetical protein